MALILVEEIYDDTYVEELFDKMSSTYERMNYITSFGFSHRWRKQCVKKACIADGEVVADLLTGMGECWKPMIKGAGNNGKLIALDFSQGMLDHARKRLLKFESNDIELLRENVFSNSIPSQSIDVVISGFGMKTFNDEQLNNLATEIKRILKPGGRFSLIDVSVPTNAILRIPYLFYLKRMIPFLGRLFLGNPGTYRMLGVYTSNFKNAKNVERIFQSNGLPCTYDQYFFGCASGIHGTNTKANKT